MSARNSTLLLVVGGHAAGDRPTDCRLCRDDETPD